MSKYLLTMKKYKKLKQAVYLLIAVATGVIMLFFVITSTWIGFEVKTNCRQAQIKYEGNCVEALTQSLEDEENNYRTRNSAIWSLGQLGDSQALPVLEKYYTGNIPDREPLDEVISQYELKKAMNLTSGGLNITAFVWRFGLE